MPNELIQLGPDADTGLLAGVMTVDLEHGVRFVSPPTIEQLSHAFAFALRVRHHSSRWIGQILNYVEDNQQRYGEKWSQAVSLSGLSLDTIYNYASVVRALGDRWRPRLGMSYHQAVMSLPPSEQERFLDLCDPGCDDMPPTMSRDDLRRLIREEEIGTAEALPLHEIGEYEPLPEHDSLLDPEDEEEDEDDEDSFYEEDHAAAYEPKEPLPKPKPGQPKFDYKQMEDTIALIVRLLRAHLEAHPDDEQFHINCKSSLNEFIADWKAWRRAMA